jgi:hypothetical protein
VIVFDLRCAMGHVFEAWFASGTAFDDQRDRAAIACPLCGDTAIDKAAMAPAVPAKGNRRLADGAPATVKRQLAALAAAQADVLRQSEWVGDAFAARARAMHDGEEATAAIHGRTTLAEAKALVDDGVPLSPLLLPVVPPDKAH